MLSSHSTVSSSRTLKPCNPWGGRWIGHRITMWSTVCSAPHSQAVEDAIRHLYKQERKRTTPVGRRLSRTQALLRRVIPGALMAASGIKIQSLVGLSAHTAFYWWSARCDAPMLLLSDELMRCYAAGTNGVSIWGAVRLHSIDGWALSGADVQSPLHSALKTLRFHCDEAQQVGCLRGLEGCPLMKSAGTQSQFARRRWWWGW